MNRRIVLSALSLIVLIAGGVVVYGWWHNRQPFGAAAIRPAAVVEPLESSAQNRAHALFPGGPELLGGPGSLMLRGEVTWKAPAGISTDWDEDGWFTIVVIDKRSRLKPPAIVGTSASGLDVVSGSDGVLNRVADKYSWLRGAGDIRVADSWRSGGDTLSVSPAAGSVKFLAHFPKIGASPEREFLASAPIEQSDILIALVYIGPDRQIFWASRLYG